MKSGLIEEYVLGLANGADRELVEEMARIDPEIHRILWETQQAMDQYCHSINTEMQIDLRNQLLTKLQHKADRDSTIRSLNISRYYWMNSGKLSLFASSIAIICLIVAASLFKSNRLLKDRLQGRIADNQTLENQVDLLHKSNASLTNQFAFLKDRNTMHLKMEDLDNSDISMAIIYWNEEMKTAAMHIINLPSPPTNMIYQLWADVDGKMLDMGVLRDLNSGWLALPYMPKAESLNITLEKMGGSKNPNVERLVGVARM